jgi:hypothetical protein
MEQHGRTSVQRFWKAHKAYSSKREKEKYKKRKTRAILLLFAFGNKKSQFSRATLPASLSILQILG